MRDNHLELMKSFNNKKLFAIAGIISVCIFSIIFLPATSPFRMTSINAMVGDYMNFAKSMLHGKEMYIDLYDHKGIVLIWLYVIPCLISSTSTIGVYIFESLITIGTAIACYQYLRVYLSEIKAVFITFITMCSYAFLFQCTILNTEPICILLTFILMRYIATEQYEYYSWKWYMAFGLMFAFVFWIKYPLVICIFPFWLYICIQSVKDSNGKIFAKRCVLSFMTFAIFTALLCGHLSLNGNLKAMLDAYFSGVEPCIVIPSGTYTELVFALFCIISFLLLMTRKVHSERKSMEWFFFIWTVIIVILINLYGGMREYTTCYIITLIPLIFKYIFNQKSQRVLFAVYVFIAFFMALIYHQFRNVEIDTVEKLADKYEITNENVLYISEDFGFGLYSDYGYVEKYQWKPSRISYKMNPDLYESVMEYVTEERFEYLVIPEDTYTKKSRELGELDFNVVDAVKEHYEIIEKFDFSYGGVNTFYLCRKISKS